MDYLIDVHLFRFKGNYGIVNQYAFSTKFYYKVPIEHIASRYQEYYRIIQ